MRSLFKILLLMTLFAALAACGKEGAGELGSQSYPRDQIVSVNVVSDMGDITITQSSGDTIRVESSYAITTASRERRGILRGGIEVRADSAADPSILSIYSGLRDTATLSDGEEVRVNLHIEIPQKIGSVIVQSQNGNLLIDGVRGCETSLVSNEGDITVKNSSLMGNNHIINVIGDVEIKLKSIENTESLRVSTDVGDVHVNVPQSASYEATIEQLSQTGRRYKNKEGGTRIQLSSKVGSVRFQK